MKIFYNSKVAKIILGKNYTTITLGPYVFTKLSDLPNYVKNEEQTHILQWRDCLCVFLFLSLLMGCIHLWLTSLILLIASPFSYYLVYLIMQIVELIRGAKRGECFEGFAKWNHKAYLRNSMEREAKETRYNDSYNKFRAMLQFLTYL